MLFSIPYRLYIYFSIFISCYSIFTYILHKEHDILGMRKPFHTIMELVLFLGIIVALIFIGIRLHWYSPFIFLILSTILGIIWGTIITRFKKWDFTISLILSPIFLFLTINSIYSLKINENTKNDNITINNNSKESKHNNKTEVPIKTQFSIIPSSGNINENNFNLLGSSYLLDENKRLKNKFIEHVYSNRKS